MFGRVSYQKLHVGAGTSARSRASWPARTTRRSWASRSTGRAPWARHAVNELLVGFTHVKFQTIPTDWAGIGDANATIGIPGGQPIPGLSNFNIGNVGFGDAGITEFNDIKSYQVTEKFSLFKGRHQLKFGGRWLYQQQGFSYSGNEGILGHFNYTGAFTGFAFADFLLDAGPPEGPRRRCVSVHPSPASRRHLRPGRLQDPQRPHAEPGPRLGVHLAAGGEGRPPVQHRPHTGQLLLAGQDGNSRALYDAVLRRLRAARGLRLDAHRKVGRPRRRSGSCSTWRALARTCGSRRTRRSTSKASRSFDATTGPGTAAIGFADVTPNVERRPGDPVPDLRPRPAAAAHEAVERVRRAQADRLALGPGRLRRQPFEPHGRPVRLQPAGTRPGPVGDVASAGPAAAALPAQPERRHDQRHELDRRRRLRRPAGERAAAPRGGPGVPRVLHLRQGAERQRRLLRRRLGPDGGPGLLLPGQHRPAARLRTVALRRAAHVQPRRQLRAALRQGTQVRNRLVAARRTRSSAAGTSTASSRRARASPSPSGTAPASRCRPPGRTSGRTASARADSTAPASTIAGSTSTASRTRPAGSSAIPASGILHGPGYWNWDLGLSKDFYFDDSATDLQDRGLQRPQPSELRAAAGSGEHRRSDHFGRILNMFSAPRIVELVLKFTF